MRKTFLFFVIVLFISQLHVNAQTVEVGLKAGLSLTDIASSSFTGSYKPAFHGGAFATKKINDTWGVQVELLYNQVTANKSDQFDKIYYNLQNTLSDGTVGIGYVSVPVVATYKYNKTFSFVFGPQISAAFYTSEILFRDGKKAFKPLDVSLTGGVKVNLSQVKFYARYNYGLSNINNYDDRDTWKNMQLCFGFEVPIFKLAKK